LPRAIAIGAAVSAMLIAGYWWLRDARPEPESGAASARVSTPGAMPPPSATVPSPAAALTGSPLPAALTHAFHDVPLPRALMERLEKGDVVAVAGALERSGDPTAAVQLGDLAALCATVATADPASEGVEARAALIAGGAGPDARAVIDSGVVAVASWRARARPGCAAAAFDPARIRARLEAAAAAGDAASLERLAEQDPLPLLRLQSAALLGSARAQYRVALAILSTQPFGARGWLDAAAKRNPDAAALQAGCVLTGCFGPPDAPAARSAFESAARRGALFALGTLSSAEAAGGPRRWARSDAPLVPSAPGGPEALGLDASSAFAWTAFAAALARSGCFGFEFLPAAEALEAEARFKRNLRPAELDAARAAAAALEAADGAGVRRALGCAAP
jgi:hypothetical protein